MKVAVIGRGKLGRTLSRALSDAAVDCTLVRGHPLARSLAPFDVYILAVPDARIAEVAVALAPAASARAVALHCAGARAPSELAALAERGAATAVFHPLVSFADERGRGSLRGATFTLYGDARAVRVGRLLARKLGAHAVALPPKGPPMRAAAYHAAAALVANGAAALAHHGARVFAALGFSETEATRAAASLLASVARNVETVGVPAALTGPVVRGDTATVARHLSALAQLDRGTRAAYAAVQPVIVETARAAGLAPSKAREIAAVASAPSKVRSKRK